MKKRYFAPIAENYYVAPEGMIATSNTGGLNNGDNVGNKKPDGDDDENFFSSHRQGSIWD